MASGRIAAAAAMLFAAAAQAATINTTLSVTNATVLFGANSSVSVSGPAILTNIGTGTFSGTGTTTTIASGTLVFTITLNGGLGTITGTVSGSFFLNASSGSGTGSATITGGTGTYAGATGTFPSLSGQAAVLASGNIVANFSGAGTITASGAGSGGGPPAPTVTAVLDAGSYTPGVAQGSVFVVKGSNLSASGFTQLSFPLPTSSSGVSINFTPQTGGTATPALLDYLYNQAGVNQLAAILPSSVPPGNYNVTVTAAGSTSAPFLTQVVKSKPALITGDSTGSGLAVAQNFISASQLDVNRFTVGSVGGLTISPARPGQTLIAYSVGMGPDPGPDNVASPGYNFLANGATVNVIVGGMIIPATYAGRVAGGSGYEQINFVLPANVPTGCTTPFQISVNGTLSLPAFLAIAPDATSNACVQAGYKFSDLQGFDNGKAVYTGSFFLSQLSSTAPSTGTVKIDAAGGSFKKYTGFQLSALAASPLNSGSVGGCTVLTIPGPQVSGAGGGGIALDAGALTLSGPSGTSLSNTPLLETNNVYSLNIGEEGLPPGVTVGVGGKLLGGTYTLNGAGGADVGKFSATVTLGSPVTVTGGLPSVITRSAGLTMNWTGGNPADIVEIFGAAGAADSTGNITSGASFLCLTTAGNGTYTVSSSILNQLPAASGQLYLNSFGSPTSGNGKFTAQLVQQLVDSLSNSNTIDNSSLVALIGSGSLPVYK